jgi:hypothetical protein
MRSALSQATTIPEVKVIIDKSKALQTYAREIGETREVQDEVCKLRIRAEGRAGELLEDIPKQHGARGVGKKVDCQEGSPLLDLGINHKQSSRWQGVHVLGELREGWIDLASATGRVLKTGDVYRLARLNDDRKRQKAIFKAVKDGKCTTLAQADVLYLQKQAAGTAKGKAELHLAGWEDWLGEQPECDLLLTDPPYATDIPDIEAFANAWLPEAIKHVKPTGRAFVCIGAYPVELHAYFGAAQRCADVSLAQVLVWTYRNTLGPSLKGAYKANWQAVLYFVGGDAPDLNCPIHNERWSVQDVRAPDGRQGDRFHEWQKPDVLAERFIRHSTSEGGVIVDPFAGTGTFLLAAKKLGRIGLGCDSSREMCDIAEERGVDVHAE